MNSLHPRAVALLRTEVENKLKSLLETKHLYQSVKIDTSALTRLLDEAKKSEEVRCDLLTQNEVEEAKDSFTLQPDPTQYLPILIRDFKEVEDTFLTELWVFYTADDLQKTRALSKGTATETFLTLPTICAPCSQCDAVKPPHNPGFKDMCRMTTPFDPIACDILKGGKTTKCQTFVFPYVCQSCKKEPLVFLVRREGFKLTLVGRNHFETPHLPTNLPKEESHFFADAIVAFNTGCILSGLFQLRTTIEQYMRRVTDTTGKLSGDELADQYATLLADDFPKSRYPSLKSVYDELSACIHAADANEAQFLKSRADIEKHFALLEHLPLKTPS